ncbi:MAG: DUF4432 family protein, partial [Candidatus Ratteibacteria bacterium]
LLKMKLRKKEAKIGIKKNIDSNFSGQIAGIYFSPRMFKNFEFVKDCILNVFKTGYKWICLHAGWHTHLTVADALVHDVIKKSTIFAKKIGLKVMVDMTPDAWMKSFIDYYPGGWQEIFPNAGGMCEYKGAILGLHGEVSLLPWEYKIIEDSKDKVSVKFSVYTYRTPFYLEKTITIKSGTPYIEIDEEVRNLAGEEVDFIWGHHPAFGKPFLSESCVINIKGGKVKVVSGDGKSYTNLKKQDGIWPFVEGIDGKFIDISKVPSENDNVSDIIFISQLEEGYYEIINEKLKIGFFMEFPKEIFKYIWFWRIARGSYNYPWWGRTYNIALEPFSSLPVLSEAIKRNDQLKLKEKGSLKVSLKAGVKKI